MAPKKVYPYEITSCSSDEENLIRKCVYGSLKVGGFVKCGSEGYIMPARFKKHADIIYNFKVRADDTWVITFPRSGTTWTQEMVWLLENNLGFEAAKTKPLYERFPMLETTSAVPDIGMYLIRANFLNLGNFQGLNSAVRAPSWETIEKAPSPRFIKTHLPLSMLPPNLLNTARVVYVARDPRDVAVSYYYLQKMVTKGIVRASFFEFWEAFRRDLLPWTPVISHSNEAWMQRNHPNMHFMFYEDLKNNLLMEIRKMCKFLGREYTETRLEQLVKHLSFNNFKNNKNVNNNIDTDNKVQFVRKGEAGGWVNYFDNEMIAQAETYLEKRLKRVEIRYPSIPLEKTLIRECTHF